MYKLVIKILKGDAVFSFFCVKIEPAFSVISNDRAKINPRWLGTISKHKQIWLNRDNIAVSQKTTGNNVTDIWRSYNESEKWTLRRQLRFTSWSEIMWSNPVLVKEAKVWTKKKLEAIVKSFTMIPKESQKHFQGLIHKEASDVLGEVIHEVLT